MYGADTLSCSVGDPLFNEVLKKIGLDLIEWSFALTITLGAQPNVGLLWLLSSKTGAKCFKSHS